jgi:hypothetical protein
VIVIVIAVVRFGAIVKIESKSGWEIKMHSSIERAVAEVRERFPHGTRVTLRKLLPDCYWCQEVVTL